MSRKPSHRCIVNDCTKVWMVEPTRTEIVIHFNKTHRSNLSFLPSEQVFMFAEPILVVIKTGDTKDV